jgi:ribosomal protein S18 acetylase RimI-like enzyme
MTGIRCLSAEQALQFETSLSEVLCDTVDSGASIGFLPPVTPEEASEYWSTVVGAMRSGTRILIAAEADGRILGCVQLGLESRPNGRHRAEVMKLMVHREARAQGLGRALMEHAHRVALGLGRWLLVLDTRSGDVAEQLYYWLGYTKAGVIPGYARSASGELHDTVLMYLCMDQGLK